MNLATIVAMMMTLAVLTDGWKAWDRRTSDLLKLPCDKNWVSHNGNGCEKYGKNKWCRKDKKNGDYYGIAWRAQ